VRLRRLSEELGSRVIIEHRAFPLRPAADPSVRFQGTYREEGWRRCARMSAADGITFTPWPHEKFADWSLPAQEAATCAARQGDEAHFERLHLRLYEAFFRDSRNIADRDEVTRIVAETDADMARFADDYASGVGRDAVLADYRAAVTEEGVQAIPTVIVGETGERVVGLADVATYRAAIEEAAA
jgi:predicted DsbA family dithiol-disulfide isomerase